MKYKGKIKYEALRRLARGDKVVTVSLEMHIPYSTVKDWSTGYLKKGIKFDTLRECSEAELDEIFGGSLRRRENVLEPDYEAIFLKTLAPTTTRQNEYDLYLSTLPPGYSCVSRTTFFRELQKLAENTPPHLRAVSLFNSFKPAQICMIDYSGDGVKWWDKKENKFKTAQIFVGVLCYSGLIYCCATERQTREDWLNGLVGMYRFFDGVTEELWLDNSTSLVKKADKYDPILSDAFQHFCEYYNTLGYAVEPGKCRHKALVENAVQQCQNKILAQLKGEKYFSLAEINKAIEPLLAALNDRELTERPGQSRRSRYEKDERQYLRPLPIVQYSANSVLLKRKVRKGNQIRIKNTRYNVPWGYEGKQLLVQVLYKTSEISIIHPDSGEILTTTKLRSVEEGPEPIRKELIPKELQYLVESKEELLLKIRDNLGPKAYEVGQAIAKLNNSLAVRHLRGLLTTIPKYDPSVIEKVYEELLKRPVITYRSFNEALREQESKSGILRKTIRLPHAVEMEVKDCKDVRGSDHYAELANKKKMED